VARIANGTFEFNGGGVFGRFQREFSTFRRSPAAARVREWLPPEQTQEIAGNFRNGAMNRSATEAFSRTPRIEGSNREP